MFRNSALQSTPNSLIKEHARIAFYFFSTILSIFHIANKKTFHHTLIFYVINEKIFPPYSFILVCSFIREFRVISWLISSSDKDVHIKVQQDPSSSSSSSSEDSSGDENKEDHTDLVCNENKKEISELKPAEDKDLEENLHPMNQYIM